MRKNTFRATVSYNDHVNELVMKIYFLHGMLTRQNSFKKKKKKKEKKKRLRGLTKGITKCRVPKNNNLK